MTDNYYQNPSSGDTIIIRMPENPCRGCFYNGMYDKDTCDKCKQKELYNK